MNYRLCLLPPFAWLVFAAFFAGAPALSAQENGTTLPLKKVSLFSSGVGYFEHSGVITGKTSVRLLFNRNTINDALKSLVINDADSSSPSVRYVSGVTLERILKSLKIDLSDTSSIAAILGALQGTEVSLRYKDPAGSGEEAVRGRILTAETVVNGAVRVTISAADGIKIISLNDITNISFPEEELNTDLNYALDLISTSRDMIRSRAVYVELAGSRKRGVTINYVIPVPVWKISYRLDLSGAPALQAWAVIDNDGDTDWNNVEVSLVSGKPVSFIQPLSQPYYTARPTLPLAGAGFAEAGLFDSAWDEAGEAEELHRVNSVLAESPAAKSALAPAPRAAYEPEPYRGEKEGDGNGLFIDPPGSGKGGDGSVLTQGSAGRSIAEDTGGEQFEFVLKKPVNLPRRQSAMLPVFEGNVKARKVLVFSVGKLYVYEETVHPAVCAEIINTTGIKLPAASITVFDMGNYAGDALISFLPENEKRLVSFGEDLSVSGSSSFNNTQKMDSVKISKGVVHIQRKFANKRSYSIRNGSDETKTVIIEHPKTWGWVLADTVAASEQTDKLYRFEMPVHGKEVLTLEVTEERITRDEYVISNWSTNGLIGFSNSEGLPANIKAALERVRDYKLDIETAKTALKTGEDERVLLLEEQTRIRENLKVTGTESPQGKNYLEVLVALDGKITSASDRLASLRRNVRAAEEKYSDYILSLEF